MDEQADISGITSGVPEEILVSQEEFAYGFIMEVLTRGLYSDKLHVIREYVQNAYDAILEFRRLGHDNSDARIDVRIETPSIVIFDNGIGMDEHRIGEYRYVGHSRKLTRESVGFRGIGKLSGISAAGKIIVTTSQLGSSVRYQLLFDAEAMLEHVETLKTRGENIPLNDLITQYTSLETYAEDPDAHFTMVELYKVRPDSQELMDESRLREYLRLTAPLDFDPDFEFGKEIDQDLRKYVEDYDTIPVYVNGKRIYKPYFPKAKSHQRIMVFSEDNGKEEGDSEEESRLLAYCWYCEHQDKGQFGEEEKRGLFYRVKNFAVGDNQLPRITLWKSSPERAFYFFGEIHICDPEIVPSADRTNFEQNSARDRLYRLGSAEISRTLNKVAGQSSDVRRATDFIVKAEETVIAARQKIDTGGIPAELKVPTIVDLSRATEDVEKRLKNAPEQYKERGKKVIEEARSLVERLDVNPQTEQSPPATYDIKDVLNLGPEGRWVYETIVSVLKREFSGKADVFKQLITNIHESLQGSGRDSSD